MTDKALDDWWKISESKVKSKKGRNIHGGSIKLNSVVSKQTPRGRLVSAMKRTPEAMLKARRGGKNLSKIKANFDYISRNGNLEVEDEHGNVYHGKTDISELKSNWKNEGYRIPENGERRAEAFNLILSMPAGTDRESVKNASREFAKSVFNGHQYVFVSHEDEPHPHVHIAVKMVNKKGIRMNPRKADLQTWREIFVDKLNEQGVEANATPRHLRGVIKKSRKQAVKHIPEDKRIINDEQSTKKNKSIINAEKQYGVLARELVKGSQEDKKLAVDIVRFVQSWQNVPSIDKNVDKQKDKDNSSLEK